MVEMEYFIIRSAHNVEKLIFKILLPLASPPHSDLPLAMHLQVAHQIELCLSIYANPLSWGVRERGSLDKDFIQWQYEDQSKLRNRATKQPQKKKRK